MEMLNGFTAPWIILIGLWVAGGFMSILIDSYSDDAMVINSLKQDVSKLRFLPRIICLFFIFIIEYSYKLGQTVGKFLKFLFVKKEK